MFVVVVPSKWVCCHLHGPSYTCSLIFVPKNQARNQFEVYPAFLTLTSVHSGFDPSRHNCALRLPDPFINIIGSSELFDNNRIEVVFLDNQK